jgi:hypothetical protein
MDEFDRYLVIAEQAMALRKLFSQSHCYGQAREAEHRRLQLRALRSLLEHDPGLVADTCDFIDRIEREREGETW